MRVVVVTGKGGVGKTTIAAASAVRAARSGARTLVLSADGAHSLGDVLSVDLSGQPVQVEPRLHALQVSTRGAVDGSWRVVQDYLLDVFAAVGVDPVVADELTALPGAEEVAALVALRSAAESAQWDVVVVDCAPTAETLRLLALPEALTWHLRRLLPGQRGLLRALRPAAAVAAGTGVPPPPPEVLATVSTWYRHMREVHALLTGPSATVRLVVTPERVVVAEARRTWTSLSLIGCTVDQVVVNRVVPAPTSPRGDPWRRSWHVAQRQGLAELAESFGGMPMVQVPYLPTEPVGLDALDAVACVMAGPAGSTDPLQVGPIPSHRPLTVRRSGSGYLLTLRLPLVTAAEVDLHRRDIELLVAVGDQRRVLSLPSALQRCVVRGARVVDGSLVVRFEPDPELWPALAGSGGETKAAHG